MLSDDLKIEPEHRKDGMVELVYYEENWLLSIMSEHLWLILVAMMQNDANLLMILDTFSHVE